MKDALVQRSALELRADAVRASLCQTLEILTHERFAHTGQRVRLRLRDAALLLVGLAVLGVATAVAVRMRRRSDGSRPRALAATISRAWRHPERIARREVPGWLASLGGRFAVGALVYAAVRLSRYIAEGPRA
jgi:hypothetical protein